MVRTVAPFTMPESLWEELARIKRERPLIIHLETPVSWERRRFRFERLLPITFCGRRPAAIQDLGVQWSVGGTKGIEYHFNGLPEEYHPESRICIWCVDMALLAGYSGG